MILQNKSWQKTEDFSLCIEVSRSMVDFHYDAGGPSGLSSFSFDLSTTFYIFVNFNPLRSFSCEGGLSFYLSSFPLLSSSSLSMSAGVNTYFLSQNWQQTSVFSSSLSFSSSSLPILISARETRSREQSHLYSGSEVSSTSSLKRGARCGRWSRGRAPCRALSSQAQCR